MSRGPRLLFVSPRFLFPLDQGGRIRTVNILRHLSRASGFQIVLASPAPPDADRFAADLALTCHRFISWPEPSRGVLRKALLLPHPLPVSVAVARSPAAGALIRRELAAGVDLLLADFPHSAPLLPERLPASVMFTHNVEAEIFERHAAAAVGAARRLVWRDQAAKMRRFELATLRRFDTVIAVSARDAEALRTRYGLGRVAEIATGVDVDYFAPAPPPPAPARDGGTIVFSGAMDSSSNIDGMRFLLRDVWPIVARARPAARMLVVGRNPPRELMREARTAGFAWEFTGYVTDVRPYTARGHVFVIPLRVGSGTRIKAFEAMASGRPVVSTAIGMEGLDVLPGRHFLQADDAAAFAAAILSLLADGSLRAGLAAAARARVAERFSWAAVARQFERICLDTLARRAEDYQQACARATT